MYRKRYSSPAAGGGVRGKDVGTDPTTMTEGGVITGERQVFTDIFMLVGEMISGIIGGEGNRGNITGYITMIFITIGVTGKEPGIGTVVDLDLVGTVVEALVISVEVIPVEVIPVEVIPVEVIPVEVIPVEVIPVVEDLVNPVVVDLVSVEENPVYNLVPIIREMKDYKRTG
jgi:hypothetical protein